MASDECAVTDVVYSRHSTNSLNCLIALSCDRAALQEHVCVHVLSTMCALVPWLQAQKLAPAA